MKSWFKLYKVLLISYIKKFLLRNLIIYGILSVSLAIMLSSLFRNGSFPIFLTTTVTGYLILLVIITILDIAIQTAFRYGDYKALNEYGFSSEYLNYYYNRYIHNKPKNDYHCIIYAESFMKIGDYDSAIKTLNTLVIPESKAVLRTMYLYVYLMTALKMNDSALADDIWRTNQAFLNRMMNNRKSLYNKFLYLAVISADCAAGRYERALDTVNRYLSGELDKHYKDIEIDFTNLKVYILKKLGRTDEMEIIANQSLALIAKKRPLLAYDWQESKLYDELNNAKNGILPL